MHSAVNSSPSFQTFPKLILKTLLSLAMVACSHPLEIAGEGDILSDSGTRDCLYEEFLAGATACTDNLVLADYDERYEAVPRPGQFFYGWHNYCETAGKPECLFDVPAEFVALAWGASVPPLRAEFDTGSYFEWTTTGPGTITREATLYRQSVDGIEAVIRAYTAEWDGTNLNIIGPFPTNLDFGTQSEDGFVMNQFGLHLEVGAIGGLNPQAVEFCSGGGCGFDNFEGSPSVTKSNFAVIEFSEAVDVARVTNTRISNFDRDYFVASSLSAPDLSGTLQTALSGASTTLHEFQGGTQVIADGLVKPHGNIRYLIIGAPLNPIVGVLPQIHRPDAGGDTFRILSMVVRPAVI